MWLCQALRKIIWPKREEGSNKRLLKITYLGALLFVLLTRYYLGDQVADEMDGDVACMGGKENAFRVLMGKSEVKRHLNDVGIGGRVILKRILKK